MTTHEQNKKAIKEGQQGGPAQKNQNAQLGLRGEQALKEPTGIVDDRQNPQSINPGPTGTLGGKGKQDAPRNQKKR
jgi:hypothetical protein